MAISKPFSYALTMLLSSLALTGLAGRALAGASGITQTQTSANYRVEVDIQPAATMLTMDQAATATSGEVMVETPNMMSGMSMGSMGSTSASSTSSGPMSMPSGASSTSMGMNMGAMSAMSNMSPMMMQMATTDQGQPVNHHLEAHIYDKTTGAVVAYPVPTITITDDTTGASRTLSDVMGMYDIHVGASDLHYGNNVYLQDGNPYTIQVTVGSDTVTFMNVVPSDGMGLSSGAMEPMSPMPSSMPAQSMP